MRLDETDLKILRLLQDNGRLSNQELADLVALSPSSCHRRVKILEQEGLIENYSANLSAGKLGFAIEAFVEVNIGQLNESEHQYLSKALATMDEVLHAYIVTGQANYMLHIRTRNFETFSNFVVHKLNTLRGVTKIHSQIVLSCIKAKGQHLPV